MTELEKAVCNALRLSTLASETLLPEIQRCIDIARAELIRSGVSVDKADENLVNSAIVTYCQMAMGDADNYERYFTAFQYQQDNLRKHCYEE